MNQLDYFPIRTYYKSELAHLYNPDQEMYTAMRTLNRWIRHNPKLLQALLSTGYNLRCHSITPKQVKLIVDYLGEP